MEENGGIRGAHFDKQNKNRNTTKRPSRSAKLLLIMGSRTVGKFSLSANCPLLAILPSLRKSLAQQSVKYYFLLYIHFSLPAFKGK